MMNFAYLIGDAESGFCAAVDPAWDAHAIKRSAAGIGWKIQKILLTHAHFDHANAAAELSAITGSKVFVHRLEPVEDLKGVALEYTEEGTIIKIGKLEIECIHTPGHTQGSQCFLAYDSVITGDTLFVDACGRVDLPGGSPSDMTESLKRLANLPAATKVYPGHDYGRAKVSSIGEERRNNMCMRNPEGNVF
jgi:glyoxylase-like metal-dependent hydrolase (beta-lactamase superfamily II)